MSRRPRASQWAALARLVSLSARSVQQFSADLTIAIFGGCLKNSSAAAHAVPTTQSLGAHYPHSPLPILADVSNTPTTMMVQMSSSQLTSGMYTCKDSTRVQMWHALPPGAVCAIVCHRWVDRSTPKTIQISAAHAAPEDYFATTGCIRCACLAHDVLAGVPDREAGEGRHGDGLLRWDENRSGSKSELTGTGWCARDLGAAPRSSAHALGAAVGDTPADLPPCARRLLCNKHAALTCCTMEKEPVMRACEAMMAARVAITTMGHSREGGTLDQ